MLHYICFGSGSSGNCSLLYTEKESLLLDAGVGVRLLKKHFKLFDLKLTDIQNILVTHDHSDHIRCVGSLARDYNLPVYATAEVHRGIERSWAVRSKIDPSLQRQVVCGEPFNIGSFNITAFRVPHDSSDNVGYCIEHEGVCFVLMTDVGHVTDEMKPFVARANYLVIEADYETERLINGSYSPLLKQRIMSPTGHMSNEDCAKTIADNASDKLKHVWLCHLSDENNHPVLAEKTVRTLLEAKGFKVGAESDAHFQLEVLKRTSPSGIYDLI